LPPLGQKDPVLAIAAPVRSEAPYLLEWIAFHRALGIRAFVLGDNGGDDGTPELLRELHTHGIIIRLDWLGQKYFHLDFYLQAIAVAKLFAKGLFLIDVDEFLHPLDDAASVVELAHAWLDDPTVGAVAINWAVYGSSGQQERQNGLVIERFVRRAPQDHPLNRHVKTFVRVDRCAGPCATPHAVALTSGRYIDSRGQDVEWDQSRVPVGVTSRVEWHRLRVDHFVLKSRAEFEGKRARGSATGPRTEQERARTDYFAAHDRNETMDPMPEALVERTRVEMAHLSNVLGRSTVRP
jgi:hypothetical protein